MVSGTVFSIDRKLMEIRGWEELRCVRSCYETTQWRLLLAIGSCPSQPDWPSRPDSCVYSPPTFASKCVVDSCWKKNKQSVKQPWLFWWARWICKMWQHDSSICTFIFNHTSAAPPRPSSTHPTFPPPLNTLFSSLFLKMEPMKWGVNKLIWYFWTLSHPSSSTQSHSLTVMRWHLGRAPVLSHCDVLRGPTAFVNIRGFPRGHPVFRFSRAHVRRWSSFEQVRRPTLSARLKVCRKCVSCQVNKLCSRKKIKRSEA